MAESTAIIGYGSKFYYGSAITGPWTEIAEVITCPPPSPEVDEAEVTHQQSPDQYREFIASLIDPGEFELELNYRADTHEFLMTNIAVNQYFRVELPDGSTFDFRGYIKGIANENPIDDRIMATATIRVGGAITATYA